MRIRHYIFITISLLYSYTACSQPTSNLINPLGATIETRISPPKDYTREQFDSKSFGYYLRNLPLKAHGSIVKYYNGDNKTKKGVYIAVVDMEIGKRDLQQCADAVMRLRGEYLYKQQKYSDISFNFTNGFKADYSEWMKGKRILVKGNQVKWIQSAQASNTYADFRKYIDVVFMYAGTLSLSKELKTKSIDNITIGDVFIQGGSPGHAVIVVDIAINPKTKHKVFLLAQSYMPAQDIQILENPNNNLSPWYSAAIDETLRTPEWSFRKTDLKTF